MIASLQLILHMFGTWVPYIDARRETLRLVGDYILTGNDQRRLGVLVLVGGGGRADRPVYAGRRPGAGQP